MLVDPNIIKTLLVERNITITGVLHLGAHECEEMPFYQNFLGLSPNDILWIDGNEEKVRECNTKGIPNVHHAVITNKDGDTVDFHIANNGQSSSILEMNTHLKQYPYIFYVNQVKQKTVTLDTFFDFVGTDTKKYSFWNLDIQGAELLALHGATKSIQNAKVIYLEVNVDELYKDCARIDQVDEFMCANGFERVHLTMSQYGWGDAIYIRA